LGLGAAIAKVVNAVDINTLGINTLGINTLGIIGNAIHPIHEVGRFMFNFLRVSWNR